MTTINLPLPLTTLDAYKWAIVDNARMEIDEFENPLCIGTICELDRLEMEYKRNYFFCLGNQVFLCYSESIVHSGSQRLIINRILLDIQRSCQNPENLSSFNAEVLICHKYSCGTFLRKQSDGAIGHVEDIFSNPEVIFEVAFTHEPLSLLFLEGATYLTENVPNIEYFIGIYIRPSIGDTFYACIFILQRITLFNPDNNDRLNSLSKKHSLIGETGGCIKNSLYSNKHLKQLKFEDINPNLCNEYNVYLVAKHEITDENLSSTFNFNINLNIFAHESGLASIELGPRQWEIIRTAWEGWKESHKQ